MYAYSFQFGTPDWSGQAQRRLLVSCAMSAFCIVTVLLVLRFPVAERSQPLSELLVRILVEEVRPDLADAAEERLTEERVPEQRVQPDGATDEHQEPVKSPTRSRDWYAQIPEAVSSALDDLPRQYSVNPVFDEKRRRAAEKFPPGKAPREVPIWENVEKDTLGRTVLWSGDCYRVLDDPNVGSREAFETFGQYMVSCLASSDAPEELPWVREIKSRRASQARYGRQAAE